jgi:exopolyphosphatase/guanosine-5'-triphosphate,3'-diphosphate pyrophosphatase
MEQQILLSADLTQRLAAIDIGTNSVRLIIAEALRDGNYRILDEERENVRLGRHLEQTGRLDPISVENALAALRRMSQIAAGFQVRETRCIATCAVREAADGEDFCRRARDIGVEVEVISAEREAHLAFASVQRSFNLDGKNVAVADIGGGSTEIILASGNLIESIYSTPLGAVRLSESLADPQQALSAEEFARLTRRIDRRLRKHVKKLVLHPHVLIGSGGTFTALAEMTMAMKRQVGLPVRGYEVTQADVHHLLERLRKMPAKLRRGVPGLNPDRADIIVAGLAVVDALMRRFKVNLLQCHDRGVRDGLLLSMIDGVRGRTAEEPPDREAAVERFAVNCDVDLVHGRQVARLAGQLFAQLAPRFGMAADDLPLLETAARLQDVGYLINYDQHHKHSYHLILNSRLAGFRPRELELVANIARYHRGARPKQKHGNFRQLSAEDQQRVRRLAAILRLAGGLDRSHTQQVREVTLAVGQDEIDMRVISHDLPEVDLWGAKRRAHFFEKAFGVSLSIFWQPSDQDALTAFVACPAEANQEGPPDSDAVNDVNSVNGRVAEKAKRRRKPARQASMPSGTEGNDAG